MYTKDVTYRNLGGACFQRRRNGPPIPRLARSPPPSTAVAAVAVAVVAVVAAVVAVAASPHGCRGGGGRGTTSPPSMCR